MDLKDIRIPDSPAARLAREVVERFSSPAMVNHSVRAYLWAAAHAGAIGLAFDEELLWVSAMLHDIGLGTAFDNHTIPFEDAGGNVAWVFGAGAGWPADRRRRASEIIVRHMWDAVDPAMDPEGHLLEVSTALDISGRDPHLWPQAFRDRVLAAVPRLDLKDEFGACLRDQARRKPQSSAAAFVSGGMDRRLAENPLER